jgi:hypothetical protein
LTVDNFCEAYLCNRLFYKENKLEREEDNGQL